jgi:hypothetical protein
MITVEKLTIFDKYGGLYDGIDRIGNSFEKKLFENDEWSLIDSLYQDIELINDNLAAPGYIDKTINLMKASCDPDSYEILFFKFHSMRNSR